jgi:hypothetical protein
MHSKVLAIASALVVMLAGTLAWAQSSTSEKDAWSHHAKDTAGEKHRTGSIRICARPPQAQVPLSIGISIHAEP